ncbi:MAG: 4Fe-4S dicluster domain-containing protein [Candidatus Neomarinimicrobiota bacterium]
MVSITIDGKPVQVEKGSTILAAAQQLDIKIPTLCYHPLLEPYAACRICNVEVTAGIESKLMTACNTQVQEGMEVQTASEAALTARRINLQLLMARAPAAEVVWQMAAEIGIEETPFIMEKPDQKCILCGLCVRACESIVGTAAIGFAHRGIDREVTTPYQIQSDVCITCGACAYFCPTGAITMEDIKGRTVIHQEMTLGPPKAIYIPFMQAVPNVPVINTEACIHFKTGNCGICQQVCEPDAIDYEQEDEYEEIEVGTIVLATGFQTFDPARVAQYGYGRLPNVITSLEFERLSNASGPTGGDIQLEDGTKPGRIGIIHCVGSRDKNTNAYCSKVCCMYSLKIAHLAMEKTGAEVYNFYIDMRTPGKGYEEFYDRLLEEGNHFIRGRVAEVTDWAMIPEEEGKLVIRAEDTLVGMVRRIPVDMVILAVGLEPVHDAEEVRRLFNISCGAEGWFLERHPKLAPVSTFTDGVFLAGVCQGPKDIPDSVAQSGAAAAEALALADRGYVELEPNTAFVLEDDCSGCKTCIALCPFSAISFDGDKEVAVMNEALCKGCGVCVAACPSGSIQQHLFTDEQIYAEIEGVLSYV